MNSVAFFEIQATNPTKLIAFYKTVFGWGFERQTSVLIEYYQITSAGINGGLLKRPSKTPPLEYGTNAFACSIMVNDFDKTAEKIIKNGGLVALPKFAVPGKCWQGYFIDPDNNVFGLFQVDANAGR